MIAPMQSKKSFGNQLGFTLIEMICVFVIISVLAATLFPKFLQADLSSKQKAIDFGVSELNGRETVTWALVKISPTGYQNDTQVWSRINTALGTGYRWTDGPNPAGGTLNYQEKSAPLARSVSNATMMGRWRQ